MQQLCYNSVTYKIYIQIGDSIHESYTSLNVGRIPWLPSCDGATHPSGFIRSGNPSGLGLPSLIPTSFAMFALRTASQAL